MRSREKEAVRPARRTRRPGQTAALWLFLFAAVLSATWAGDNPIVIVAFGTSLTSGFGLPGQDSFPTRLEQALQEAGLEVRVLNYGIPGLTSARAVQEVDRVLALEPNLVFLELGANDVLREVAPQVLAANLELIITRFKSAGVRVLLAGMNAPAQAGEAYAQAVTGLYLRLAAAHEAPLYPFFLEGVAGRPEYNQLDGLHPNARGVQKIVEGILPLAVRSVQEVRE
ncbi:MAG: arylesterase [Thermodesulfobacteriota bacterium]